MELKLKTLEVNEDMTERKLFEQPDLPLGIVAQHEDLAAIVAAELQYLETQGYWKK